MQHGSIQTLIGQRTDGESVDAGSIAVVTTIVSFHSSVTRSPNINRTQSPTTLYNVKNFTVKIKLRICSLLVHFKIQNAISNYSTECRRVQNNTYQVNAAIESVRGEYSRSSDVFAIIRWTFEYLYFINRKIRFRKRIKEVMMFCTPTGAVNVDAI